MNPQAVNIIHYYNHLNGNSISLPTLKNLHDRVSRYLDSVGHGPYTTELNGIRERVAKAISKMNKANLQVVGRVELDVIEVKSVFNKAVESVPKSIKKKVNKEIKKVNRKVGFSEEDFLFGLETSNPDGKNLKGLGFTQAGQQKIYDMVTNMILDTMKQGGLFWREPWEKGGKKSKKVKVNIMGPVPVNFVTKAPYSGVNYWLLKYVAPHRTGYKVLNYVTISQVNELGGKIKKGAKAWPVIYYSLMFKYKGKNITEDQFEMLSEDEQKKAQKIPFIQYYRVFNAHDVEGVPGIMEQVQARKTVLKYDVEPIKAAEAIVNDMPKRPYIQQSKQRKAYYSPGGDFVHMPFIGVFDQEQDYYSTFFHELVHSTGHESRLDRELSQEEKKYAFEELIAELGASYLCAETGILYFTLKNSAAYIKGWSKHLRAEMESDSKFFMKAAAKAQKATDFILNNKSKKKVVPKASKSMRASKRPKERSERKERDKVAAMPLPMKQVAGVKQKSKAPSQSSVDYEYTQIELGPYKNDFERMFSDSIVQIHGLPGHGKTVWLLKHAKYRALKENVLYIAREEHGRSVFDIKIKEHKIAQGVEVSFKDGDNPKAKIRFRKTLEKKDAEWAQVIFLDSSTALGIDHNEMESLIDEYPNRNWFPILQSTKDGDFRGSQEWEHLVDIAGEIRNRQLILRKNRLDPDNSTKAEKLQEQNAITEATKKIKLKKAVKEAIEPKEQKEAA